MGAPIIDQPFLETVVGDMATMSEEPTEGAGGATGSWADRHNIDLGGLVRFLEWWVPTAAQRDSGPVTQGAYWFQAGYEARRKQAALAADVCGLQLRWKIERSYPDRDKYLPHSPPEQWTGSELREFAKQLEDAAGMDRENTSVVVGELISELVMKDYLATNTVSVSWDHEDDENGRCVEATVEWEV